MSQRGHDLTQRRLNRLRTWLCFSGRYEHRISLCQILSPVGKEVVDPVGLTLIVQTIYEAFVVVTQIARSLEREMISEQLFTARGVSFYDQPSENAKSGKPKREKEKHHEWRYARRFGGSLTSTDMPRLGTIGFEGRFDYAAIGTVSNVAKPSPVKF